MKKASIFVVGVMMLAFFAASCASSAADTQNVNNMQAAEPQFVQDALNNPPEDAYVGIGTGRAMTLSAARAMSENRARVAISQQMSSSVRNMITDYTGTSEIQPDMLQFFETISRTLSESELRGSRPTTQTFRQGDTFEAWTVMTMPKTSAQDVVANAAEAARNLAPNVNAAMWSLDNMNAAFEQRDNPTVLRD